MTRRSANKIVLSGWDQVDLRCTNQKCRVNVDPGQGMQYVDEHGTLQRVCWTCWKEINRIWDESSSQRTPQQTDPPSATSTKSGPDGPSTEVVEEPLSSTPTAKSTQTQMELFAP